MAWYTLYYSLLLYRLKALVLVRKFDSHTLSLSFLCLSLYRVQDLITLGHMKQRSELVLTVAKSTGVILANFHWRRLKHTFVGMYDMNARNRQLPCIFTELNHRCEESSRWLRLYGRCNCCIHRQFHNLNNNNNLIIVYIRLLGREDAVFNILYSSTMVSIETMMRNIDIIKSTNFISFNSNLPLSLSGWQLKVKVTDTVRNLVMLVL